MEKLRFFWNNKHINPDGKETTWIPKSKKIWFTEYGFPSVGCYTNQVNVFYSPGSVDSGFPIMSDGQIDFRAQRSAISATEDYWRDSEFLEQKFMWTWDARPYPYFPGNSRLWRDAPSWKYGHFLNGKLDYTSLSDIVLYLCQEAGLDTQLVYTSQLIASLDGYTVATKGSAFAHIALLGLAFNFDASYADGVLHFKPLANLALLK